MVKKSYICNNLAVIRLLCTIVLMGYLMIWIMIPTNTYRHIWLPNLRKKFISTYFGFQGPTLLVYTFPVLFVAALTCVYLHLAKSNPTYFRRNRNQTLHKWKKPMLVNWPLGIVSGIELAFLVMFSALLIWSLSTHLHNSFSTITPQFAASTGRKVWEAKLESASLRLGLVGNIGLTLLFFPVSRGSSVLPFFGLSYESGIKYHAWLGHMVMAFFTAHGFGYIMAWGLTNHITEMVKWGKAEISNVAGEVSLVAGLGLWATTFPSIRRNVFELFFYTHHLYIFFMLFFLFHVSIAYSCIMLPGFYLFLIDRYLRFLQSRTSVRLISARVLPCQTLELNFSKSPGLSYNPTSILFVNVPSISKLQWHPFTISSSSKLEPENLSVVIKSEGSWSNNLYQMLSSPSPIHRLHVSVEGPYGPQSTHFLSHDSLVMVSGGSGITPFISIIRELIFEHQLEKRKTPQLILICSFKNSSDLSMLDLLLPVSGSPLPISNLQLKIEAYVTREKEPTFHGSKLLQTIRFKPHSTDAPISAILGPNSWLWLAAIISTSFIIFLIIIGLITRYYIYPIDHNTRTIFSYSLQSSLNMLVICLCIAMTASAAVLWNKKQNERENIEGSIDNGDKELETLPHQSLAQVTNVHYGERPDLRRMLLDEYKGTSVGVVVCGPETMRNDVAVICSSRLADNLQFESISFSW